MLWRLKVVPGMISRLFRIASSTNAVAVPREILSASSIHLEPRNPEWPSMHSGPGEAQLTPIEPALAAPLSRIPFANCGSYPVRAGNVVHAAYDIEEIKAAVAAQLRHGRYAASDIYYRPGVSQTIVDILARA